MAEQAKRQEFSVVLEGLDLPDGAVQRIEAAIRKAVTDALSELDVDTGSLEERPLAGIGGGGPVGYHLAREADA